MDNHIHIGHGVVVGKMCLFAGGVMIGGKTTIGNNVILWGQVGISKDLIIEDNVTVLAQSGVGMQLEKGKTYFGSPADELNRIFERFYRVDPARHRSTGGTGLGLSIVKHVAATHGGDVNVWSEEGHGSTFTLRLPTPQYTDENPEEQEEGPR